MKKLSLFLAALLTATVMNSQEVQTPVPYLHPVYNIDDDPSSGIKEWKTDTCTEYSVVYPGSELVIWSAGWYVAKGNIYIHCGTYCKGNVHLILTDSAQLTITGCMPAYVEPPVYDPYSQTEELIANGPGILVSDTNSLTIYGQSGQTGELIVNGVSGAAGIGGDPVGNGANITINGGIITTTGGHGAAGIGGGASGKGSNITINGGKITAKGGMRANSTQDGSGIGGGEMGSTSNIYVNPDLVVKADGTNPPTTEIAHASITTDIASFLANKRYVTIEPKPAVEVYTRTATAGKFGTICLAKKITAMEGVEGMFQPFEVKDNILYCEEVSDFVAGGAYIFKANAAEVKFTLEGDAAADPVTGNNMLGWLKADTVLSAPFIAARTNFYMLGTISGEQKLYQPEVGSTLKKNCAMINLNLDAPTAPARGRTINFGVNGTNTTTGLNQLTDSPVNRFTKMMINGQLIIMKNGKMFNTQGQEL